MTRILWLPLILLLAFFLKTGLSRAQSHSPRDVVQLFLDVYGTERMAEILPYTLPAFRSGLEPAVWLKRTQRTLRRLGYLRLEGVIRSITIKGDEATVSVASRIATQAATTRQTEIYRLQHTSRGWRLLDLLVQDEVIEAPRLQGQVS